MRVIRTSLDAEQLSAADCARSYKVPTRIERALRTLRLAPLSSLELANMDWVIGAGESGPGARPVEPDWVREIRDTCISQQVPSFLKQWGGVFKKRTGRALDGRTWDEMPLGASCTGVHFES